MILDYADEETESFHATGKSRKIPPDVQKAAMRKLNMLAAADDMRDLASPGNNLEALKGDLRGYHSIRINRQWRLIFIWDGGAREVQIVDYH